TPSRPTNSATATTPETGVNDTSGAPTPTRPTNPGILFTERVSFPQRPIGVSTTPIIPAGKASVRLCHAAAEASAGPPCRSAVPAPRTARVPAPFGACLHGPWPAPGQVCQCGDVPTPAPAVAR